jgi:hypothetical protein
MGDHEQGSNEAPRKGTKNEKEGQRFEGYSLV